jgi:hypothetical protein
MGYTEVTNRKTYEDKRPPVLSNVRCRQRFRWSGRNHQATR